MKGDQMYAVDSVVVVVTVTPCHRESKLFLALHAWEALATALELVF